MFDDTQNRLMAYEDADPLFAELMDKLDDKQLTPYIETAQANRLIIAPYKLGEHFFVKRIFVNEEGKEIKLEIQYVETPDLPDELMALKDPVWKTITERIPFSSIKK